MGGRSSRSANRRSEGSKEVTNLIEQRAQKSLGIKRGFQAMAIR